MTDSSRLATALADRYVIEGELGAGGMATVYLARDVKHDREVALKVLRPELAAVLGAERFLNEIRIAARLDHPHILTLIDSGSADGFLYYVLPYVRGESLRGLLEREGQLGIEQALTIIRQVASALDYAHRQGVIHRDIKPENVLLQEGEAMLADFGIALAVREAGGHRLTESGLSLGTPQYMSPEQATGERNLDVRSDVYSLGAVLYEMLAGEPPVTGATVQAMIAKLLTERPTSLRILRDTVPPTVDAAVNRALARVPADRFVSAGAFVEALKVTASDTPSAARPATRRPSLRTVGWGAAIVVLVAAAGGTWFWRTRIPAPSLVIGQSSQITLDPGLEIQPALSPDGKFVAYAAGDAVFMRVFIRPIGGGRTIPLSDDSMSVESQPRWSPDGTQLLFLTRGGASVAPALGGSAHAVVAGSGDLRVRAAAWSPDGREIAFVRGDSLQVVSAQGGTPRYLGTGRESHTCAWSPRGSWIACVSLNGVAVEPGNSFGNLAPSGIDLFPVSGGPSHRLVEPTSSNLDPVWSPDGRFLYFVSNRDGPRDIYALAIGRSGEARGTPTRLSTGLGVVGISLSGDGRRLAYAAYHAQSNIWSAPIGSGLAITAANAVPVTRGNQIIEAMRVSRDGRWLVYDSDLRGNSDIYRIPIGGGQAEQLTSDPADEFAGDLSPGDSLVVYHSWRTGSRDIEVKSLNSGAVERVTDTPAQESFPVWSPDGRSLLFTDQAFPQQSYLTTRGADGRWSTPRRITPAVSFADWSPEGREFVGIGYSTGNDLVLIPLSGGPARVLYQPGGGGWPPTTAGHPDRSGPAIEPAGLRRRRASAVLRHRRPAERRLRGGADSEIAGATFRSWRRSSTGSTDSAPSAAARTSRASG